MERGKSQQNSKNFKISEIKIELQRWMILKLQQILQQKQEYFKERYGLKEMSNLNLKQQINSLQQQIFLLKSSCTSSISSLKLQISNLFNFHSISQHHYQQFSSNSKTLISHLQQQLSTSRSQLQSLVTQAKKQRSNIQILITAIRNDQQKFKQKLINDDLQLIKRVQEIKRESLGIYQQFKAIKQSYKLFQKQVVCIQKQMLQLKDTNLQLEKKYQNILKQYKQSQYSKLVSYTNSRLLHLQNYIEKYEPFYSYVNLSLILKKILEGQQAERLKQEDKIQMEMFHKICLDDNGIPKLQRRINEAGKMLEQFQKEMLKFRSPKEKKRDLKKNISEEQKIVKMQQIEQQTNNSIQQQLIKIQEKIQIQNVSLQQKIQKYKKDYYDNLEELKIYVQKRIQGIQNHMSRKLLNSPEKSVFKFEQIMFPKNQIDFSASHQISKRRFIRNICPQTNRTNVRSRTPFQSTSYLSKGKSYSNTEIQSQQKNRYL